MSSSRKDQIFEAAIKHGIHREGLTDLEPLCPLFNEYEREDSFYLNGFVKGAEWADNDWIIWLDKIRQTLKRLKNEIL